MAKRKYSLRPDGRYSTSVSTGRFDENGKPIRVTLYASSSAALEREVGRVKTDLERGTYANDNGETVSTYSLKWYKANKQNSVSKATARDYYNIIINHLDLIGDIALKDLSKTDVQTQINKEGNSPEIKRRIVLTIKQILDAAIDDGLLYRNVASKIKAPTIIHKEKAPLTEAEKAAVKKCDFTPMEKTFINVLYGCGLRRSEALALHINDIDLKQRGIHVRNSLSFVGGQDLKPPKTKSSIRFVNAPDWVIKELEDYIQTLPGLYLFHGSKGQLISQSTYKRMWESIYKKINIAMGAKEGLKLTNITPHTFRHNYATMLYHNGIDVKEAQRLLGHSSIKITLEIYTHLTEKPEAVIQKINTICL